MGNINYNNFICDNYYCQSVSFKPEWLSEASWSITYNYQDSIKPYIIDKGILKINHVYNFDILFSKKLLKFEPELIIVSSGYDAALGCFEVKIKLYL